MYEDGVLKAKGLNQYMEEYSQLHPNIHFKIEKIPQSDYAATLQLMNDTGTAPDIYQVYSTWGVELQKNGVLDNPPSDIKDDVRLNYVSVAGVTIDDDIWGIPTEVNDYALIYNKRSSNTPDW
jgi:multiple sugar transport system substrate-binding protein